MMQESAPLNNLERSVFENGELLQYPPSNGEIQLAERYAEPETVIAWSQHPYTRIDEEALVDQPKAIIETKGNNIYYLRGSMIYDISATDQTDGLVAARVNSDQQFLDLELGKSSRQLRGDVPKAVTVALASVSLKEKDKDTLVDGAISMSQNPFEIFDEIVDRQEKYIDEGEKEEDKKEKTRSAWENRRTIHSKTFEGPVIDFGINPKMHIPRNKYAYKLHEKDGRIMSKIDDDIDLHETAEPVVSNHGVVISPQPGIEEVTDKDGENVRYERKNKHYTPRFLAWIGEQTRIRTHERLEREGLRDEPSDEEVSIREMVKSRSPVDKRQRGNGVNDRKDAKFKP